MKAYTLRLDDSRAKLLKHLSIEEGRNIREILIDLLDYYMQAHQETLEILSRKGWVESLKKAESDVKNKRVSTHSKFKKILNVGD